MAKAARTAVLPSLVLLFLLIPAIGTAQNLPVQSAERLLTEGRLFAYQPRPESLVLLPDYSGAAAFRARHGDLRPSLSQEALLSLGGLPVRIDSRTILDLIASVSSLSDLSYRTAGKAPVPLFRAVSLVRGPVEREGSFSFAMSTEDADFGTARWEVSVEAKGDCLELRMVNLDPLRFLTFPAVSAGKVYTDLLFFPYCERSFAYVAWSIRSAVPVPAFVDMETPLRRRAEAIGDWFVKELEVRE